jgi:hypothetical protein
MAAGTRTWISRFCGTSGCGPAGLDPAPRYECSRITAAHNVKPTGEFVLEGRGGWFIDEIDCDPSSVIGISLPLTRPPARRGRGFCGVALAVALGT